MIGVGVFVAMMLVVASLAGYGGFLLGRGRSAVAEEQARREREAAEQLRQERDAAIERSRAERDVLAAQARADREEAEEQVRVMHTQLGEAAAENARLRTELEGARLRFDEQVELLRNQQADLNNTVEQMALRVMKQTTSEVIQQHAERADQRDKAAARELDLRKDAVANVIKPVYGQIEQLTNLIQSVENGRVSMFATFEEQVKAMHKSTELMREDARLMVSALRQPHTRGLWGERQLRNVVEAAGMLSQVDFFEQPTYATNGSTLRPDMRINLGAGMSIMVDAKTPLDSFVEANNAADHTEQKKKLAEHARLIRKHIDQLATRKYWALEKGSPELVVMFLPSETMLFTAQEHDPMLWEHAINNKVVLASPTSLLMLLRTAAQIRQREAANANADRMIKLCTEMTNRIRILADLLAKLGKSLNTTVNRYNETIGSFERRLLITAREVDKLRGSEASIQELAPIDLAARQVALPAGAGASVDADADEQPTDDLVPVERRSVAAPQG